MGNSKNAKNEKIYKTNERTNTSSIGKKRVIYAIIILLLIYMVFVFMYNINKKNSTIDVSNMGGSNRTSKEQSPSVNDFYTVEKLSRPDNSRGGSIYIPKAKDENLNKYIEINIDEYVYEFEKNMEGKDQKYTLDIFFDTYMGENGGYISFVFHILMDRGEAHPNSYMWTVVYDIKKKEIVNIDNLAGEHSNFIVNISEYTYKALSQNTDIKEYGVYDMLKEGTKPIKENFRNFAIDKNNLVIFFEKYQVAPYVLGEFKVEVPIKDILK